MWGLLLIKSLLSTSNKFITFVAMEYSELFRLLKKDGWYEIRQSGSHVS